MDDAAPASPPLARRSSERGSSMIEYVGLGALSGMLVTGLAAAIDSTAGDRIGTAIVRRLLAAVSGAE